MRDRRPRPEPEAARATTTRGSGQACLRRPLFLLEEPHEAKVERSRNLARDHSRMVDPPFAPPREWHRDTGHRAFAGLKAKETSCSALLRERLRDSLARGAIAVVFQGEHPIAQTTVMRSNPNCECAVLLSSRTLLAGACDACRHDRRATSDAPRPHGVGVDHQIRRPNRCAQEVALGNATHSNDTSQDAQHAATVTGPRAIAPNPPLFQGFEAMRRSTVWRMPPLR